jgi:hypothetical protein
MRRAAGAVIPRCARCPRQRRSSAHCSWICDTTPERGARCIHSPSHTLVHSPPARDDHLWDYPTLLPPTPVTLVQRLSRAPRIPCVRSAYRRSLSSPSHSSLPGIPRLSSAGSRACASVHPQPGVHDHRRARHGRSFLRACHSLPPRSLQRLRRHPTPSLHPPLSRNTTRSLSVVCSICRTG